MYRYSINTIRLGIAPSTFALSLQTSANYLAGAMLPLAINLSKFLSHPPSLIISPTELLAQLKILVSNPSKLLHKRSISVPDLFMPHTRLSYLLKTLPPHHSSRRCSGTSIAVSSFPTTWIQP